MSWRAVLRIASAMLLASTIIITTARFLSTYLFSHHSLRCSYLYSFVWTKTAHEESRRFIACDGGEQIVLRGSGILLLARLRSSIAENRAISCPYFLGFRSRSLTASIVGIPVAPSCSIESEATQFAKSTAARGSPCL